MIDWTKPLELIDGTPVKLEPHDVCDLWTNGPNGEPDSDGDYWLVREDGNAFVGTGGYRNMCVHPNGSDTRDGPPQVRNREQPA